VTTKILIAGKEFTATPFSLAELGDLTGLHKKFADLYLTNAVTMEAVLGFFEHLARLLHASIARAMPTVALDDVRSLDMLAIQDAIARIIELSEPPGPPTLPKWSVN
jgi:hypothetical protein